MSYQIEIKREALEDIRNSFLFYENRSEGLGESFLEEIDVFIEMIKENPYLFEKKQDTFREAVLSRFPFILVYEIDNLKVIVYSVFHTKRSPQFKYKK